MMDIYITQRTRMALDGVTPQKSEPAIGIDGIEMTLSDAEDLCVRLERIIREANRA